MATSNTVEPRKSELIGTDPCSDYELFGLRGPIRQVMWNV